MVWFSPGEKHWHGATPTTAMTHIAIQEKLNGKVVDWMEKVSDEQYLAGGKNEKLTPKSLTHTLAHGRIGPNHDLW